jgi:hypothetical protein
MERFGELRVRVAGHTDDRGSDEYNLALGQRRAASVKRFLTERGVDDARVEIVSFGKERPTCEQQAESCWSRNRGRSSRSRPAARRSPAGAGGDGRALGGAHARRRGRRPRVGRVLRLAHRRAPAAGRGGRRARRGAARDTARAAQVDALAATLRRIDDSVGVMAARNARFQGDAREQLRSVREQLIQVQELTGQSQRRLQDLRASLEASGAQAAPAAPPRARPTRARRREPRRCGA